MEKTCKIPASFRIGAITEEVNYEAGLFQNFNRYSLGIGNTGEIRIARSVPLTIKKEHVFMQLYLWCGDFAEGIDVNNAEQRIAALHVFALIRDNPQLLNITEPIWGIKRIRAFSKWFRIHKRPGAVTDIASLEPGLLLIDVLEDAKIDMQWLSLWHEITHLIRVNIGQDLRRKNDEESEEEEERIVEGFAYMLCTLLSENDMSWLLETEDETIDIDSITSRVNAE